MFKIFVQVENYRSIIVLMAETLDFLEQKGVRKIDKLPYWMHKYLFFIIEEKGLKYLNDMLQKLNFYDEAVIDTIEIAKNWRMKGVTYWNNPIKSQQNCAYDQKWLICSI